MKKNLNEQVSRIKEMMKKTINENFDDLASNIDPRTKFKSAEDVLKSATDRLVTAVQLQEWSLVEEVVSDLISFHKNNRPEENDYNLPGYDETMDNLDNLSIRR